MSSDLNNLEVITATSKKYAGYFGFSEKEVLVALEEYGMADRKQQVKDWYDGFSFVERKESIIRGRLLISLIKKRLVLIGRTLVVTVLLENRSV